MPEKFEIKLDKKEVKNALSDVTETDYFQRISAQVKKLRSGQMNQAFKGNAEKWEKLFHTHALEKYDTLILSILREEYQTYQEFIDPIKKLIGFHKINLKQTLQKEIEKKK
ncbi:MAG: hypothetical protein ACTSYB_04005 [Candidatus Helarchaeota archaeon]